MGDKYGLIRQHSELWRSLRDGDFEEEEIWDVVKEKSNYNSEVHIDHNKTSFPISVPKSLTSAARMIPRRNNSSSSSASSSQELKALQQSAPVNIPNWSQIYRNNKQSKIPKNVPRYSNNNYDYDFFHSVDDDEGDDVVNNHNGDSENENEEEEEEEDDEYDTKLPPHEIIARRLARSQISSFSVFEGVGRTLKGRDLSKMRNAILTKTGFLESL